MRHGGPWKGDAMKTGDNLWLKWDAKTQKEALDLGCKCCALILLHGTPKGTMVAPSYMEWVGINLLERDGELPARKE